MAGIHILRMLVQGQVFISHLHDGNRIGNEIFAEGIPGGSGLYRHILFHFFFHLLERIHDSVIFFLVGLQQGRQQREYRVEDDERRQRGQILVMSTADIVTDHVTRAKQQFHEGALGIVVQERNSPFVEASVLLLGFPWLFPGKVAQFLPDGEGTPLRHQGMMLTHDSKQPLIQKNGPARNRPRPASVRDGWNCRR